ncbi:UNVERIFIED_CONTAM: hypothetical protein FKN15_001023 [Acipenser sinensis]
MSPGSVADRTEGSRGAEGGSVQMFVPLDLRANRMCACVKVEITEVADAVVTPQYENTLVSEYLFDQIQDSNPQLVQNSVSAGEAVEQGLAELVKEWKRGKLSNILPIMEFIMWALIKEEADKNIMENLIPNAMFPETQAYVCGTR